MRLCGRCGREMLTEGIEVEQQQIIVRNVNLTNKRTKVLDEVGFVQKGADKYHTVRSSVAICPECGHIEHYLNEKELEACKDLCAIRGKE